MNSYTAKFMAEPHLWKHPNGNYYVLWQDHGRTRRKSLDTKDKRIANRRLNNFKRDLLAGKIIPIAASKGISKNFFSFVDEFLKHVESTLADSTYVLYDVALRKAKSCWGDIPLSHITHRHIDHLVADMARAGLKKPTINKNYRHIKRALNKAYDWEYIKVPVKFPKPLEEEDQIRYLTKAELAAIIGEITDPEFADLCLFSAYTGLRSGEILRLQWIDIDNPEGFIRVSSKQKNKKERRAPINRTARAILKRCKIRGNQKVFSIKSESHVSHKFKRAARAAGLEWPRFHDLRHTFGSHLAMSGENEKAIQDLMGHKAIASTLIYTKVSPEYLKEASESVNYGPIPLPSPNSRK